MAAQFNEALLLLARQYRDRSQAEVAEASGLNQGHYSRIENGLLPDGPSEENVVRIADALNFPPSFFYQRDGISGLPLSVHPMHRKKASVGERTLRQVHAELNLRLMHIRRYLAAVDTKAELPLPWIDVDEGGGPGEIARQVRKAWMLPDGPIESLTECCERAGVLVIRCDFAGSIDGVTMRLRDLPPCVFLNRSAPADRMRHSLAHELGHLVMHRVPTDDMEDEANAFASELLVPERQFRRHVIGNRITLEFLARQKMYWRVSMASLLYRAGHLGLINRNQSEYLWKQISALGWRMREPQETDFPHEEPTVFPRVLRLHSDGLGYDVNDFAKLLHANTNDVRQLYGDYIGDKKPRLFVVR
ncbi:MAG TPA: ImmA/IrrE family metallo-endopeptidase [Acetobacteraceae bacterium]|nr:ImmA/IrrE family metallo-endopeptidase [Acetobacteraceae bacterium]